jgi:hypothetical protein
MHEPWCATACIHEAIADAIDNLSGKPCANAVSDDHHIEYWIWTGTRLVPASSEEEERLLLREALSATPRKKREQAHERC